MESATAHPLQALSDAITIEELKVTSRPKVVLSWAPHPKALPQAVANSFVSMMKDLDVDLSISQTLKDMNLNPEITKNTSYLSTIKKKLLKMLILCTQKIGVQLR